MSRSEKKTPIREKNCDFFKLISSLTPVKETAVKPKGGCIYLFEGTDATSKEGDYFFHNGIVISLFV